MTMYDYDPRVAEHLRTLVDDAPVPPAPTRTVLHLGRRARRRRVVTVAASGVALVVAVGTLGAVTVAGDRSPGPRSTNGAVTGAAAPPDAGAARTRLVNAVQTTGATSYRHTIGVTVDGYDGLTEVDRNYVRSLHGLALVGAFDPKTVTGYLRPTDFSRAGEQRLVAGDLYIGDDAGDGDGMTWKRVPGKQTGLSVVGLVEGGVELTTDPGRFLDALRQVGTVEPAGRTGDTETFRFSGTSRGEDGTDHPISGEVTVAGTHIGRLTYRVPPWRPMAGRPTVTVLVTVELSGHGEPVSVDRPTKTVN